MALSDGVAPRSVEDSAVQVSIVIPAFNEAGDLPDLLRSLAPLARDPDFEILVVDNGSTDSTSALASTLGAHVVHMSRAHVGAARNAGALAAKGRVLAFLDADVIVTENWIERIPEYCQLSGRITGDVYDVSTRASWIVRHWFGALYTRGAQRYLNGGNLVISREDFERVGGFDESLISGEDVEFCFRAASAGLAVIPDRKLHVRHKGYPSSALGFIRREAWHGRADFASLARFVGSPVAMTAVIFVLLHMAAIFAIALRRNDIAAAVAATIVLLCLAISLWKWRCVTLRSRVACAAVLYLYFIGRALAAWRQWTRAA